MTGIEMLTKAVEAAVERQEKKGVSGWGLNNPDPDLFDSIEQGGAFGCTSSTCAHNSHDPASPTIKLLPKAGQLVSLGYEREDPDANFEYFALVLPNTVRYFELRDGQAYWARLKEIDEAGVPNWALANLAVN